MPSCYHCRANDARCRCGQCKSVYFCNRDCQIQAWSTHRPECIPPAVAPLHIPTPSPASPVETQSQPRVPSTRPSPHTSRASDDVAENNAAHHEDDSVAKEPSKKNKKKKKKAKRQADSSGSSSPDESCCSSVAVHPTVTSPSIQIPCASNVKGIKDDWTALDTVSQKSKKKSGKATNPTTTTSKQRNQSLPGHNNKSKTALVKTKSKSMSVKKGVSWGTVSAREFARCPGGGGAVPDQGTWALGLGKAIQDVTFGPVDVVESLKAHAASQPHPIPSHSSHHHHKKDRPVPTDRLHRLNERERKEVLMQAENSQLLPPHDPSPPKHEPHRRQRRSCAYSHMSTSSDDCDAHVFASLCLEQATEFALIRSSRDDLCGCSCGDLVKKVSKMHIKKLVAWLHDRDVDTSGMAKAELLQTAKTLAAHEKNCATEDCECARNGVPCHQGVCAGCKDSCHNDRYSYKRDSVTQYRHAQLARWKQTPAVAAVC
ncbi:hypothetical protein DYB25_008115 [Aphanomyces astaci]|uniref:MYND-type domain-containing protein n=1 Tax=Aphanomyces astaci TaxID=112090 RepID=A0A397BQZ7_APHAT|nr:hypothetical protein DYB25_008115 [Aphanomyces astaci]